MATRTRGVVVNADGFALGSGAGAAAVSSRTGTVSGKPGGSAGSSAFAANTAPPAASAVVNTPMSMSFRTENPPSTRRATGTGTALPAAQSATSLQVFVTSESGTAADTGPPSTAGTAAAASATPRRVSRSASFFRPFDSR